MDNHFKAKPYTAWQLISMYWASSERFSAYALLVFALFFTIILVVFDVAFNTWFNFFYDALQDYDKRGAIDLLAIFCFLAAVYIVLYVYRFYIQQYLALRWRRWLTKAFTQRWLSHHSFYYLEHFDFKTDNPDQRIQEDIGSLVTGTLALTIGLLNAIVTLVAFVYILWELSGVIMIPLGSFGVWHLHGYLVWVGVIYAIFGTLITFKIGRPLIALNFEQQKREANFRFAAIDIRAHAEAIALYRGENDQKKMLNKKFSLVLDNWYAIILRQKLVFWFTAGYNQISVLIPLLVVLPNYFNKVFRLGGLIQAIRAFGQIQDALSFLVNTYSTIAEWRAVVQRLVTFLNHMHALDKRSIEKNKFKFLMQKNKEIKLINVQINKPDDKPLLKNINLSFVHGKHYLLQGPSGIGKSTMLRALAGIWPSGAGEIHLPSQQKIMFLPQTPYMPLGTLKEALLFPSKHLLKSDTQLKTLLTQARLNYLCKSLYDVQNWAEILSPGELQRIGFIRLLIQKPSWAFLDESTSSLDIAHEKILYQLVQDKLTHTCFISVGHRPSLAPYHDVVIDLDEYARL